MESKRISFKCDGDVNGKIESLKALLGVKRDELLMEMINARFKEVITNIAQDEGILQDNTAFFLNRDDFKNESSANAFDEICTSVNLKAAGDDKKINKIKIEIKRASVVEG